MAICIFLHTDTPVFFGKRIHLTNVEERVPPVYNTTDKQKRHIIWVIFLAKYFG